MYKTILLPTDGSELSLKAADAAIEMTKLMGSRLVVWSGAPIYVLPFATASDVDPALLMAEAKREAQANVDEVAKRAAVAGITCDTFITTTDSPWEDIIGAAKERSCDLIFMASHGRGGLAALLLGSETHKVLTHSTVPVLVYR